MADALSLKDVLAYADSQKNAEQINSLIAVQVDVAEARASQDFTDAASDRASLIKESATVDTTKWDPKYAALLLTNASHVVEASKPRRRRR